MVLDTVTAEVSQTVKTAIKAKLNELGVYVDDELPDYIMILVGNRKTKDQMDDDLSLFLGHNTERFTSWLHDVLQRLNAASVLQKETKPTKEKKEESDEEKAQPTEEPKVVEEKKKHKKKKDKSEKKKEKKEKKKKKDKDKDKEKHKSKRKEEKSKSKSKSPEEVKGDEAQSSNDVESSSRILEKSENDSAVNGSKITSTSEEVNVEKTKTMKQISREDDMPSDVVNLRPNAEDLALGLEDEPPTKKMKTKFVSKEVKEKDVSGSSDSITKTITSIEIQVDNTRPKDVVTRTVVDETVPEVSTSGGVHDRLGKRVINLREESTFPPKSSGEGMGRAISSAIASAVKSVTLGNKSEGKTGKRLEARVRPLVSSRIQPQPEEEEEVDDVALPPTRLVSTVGAVLKRSHSHDDSDDDDEPPSKRLSGVASKVEVTPRPRRPGALQANTALILRAVADAHKSVNKPSRKAVEDKEEERGRKEIFSRSYQERQNQRLSTAAEGKTVKKFAITVPNSILKENVEMKISGKPTLEETYLDEVEMDDIPINKEDILVKSKILPQPKIIATNKVMPMQVDETTGSTRFIVTLDGFGNEVTSSDLRSKIRGRPVRTPSVDEEEFIEEVEEWEEEVEEMEGVTPSPGAGVERVTSAVGNVAPKWKAKIDASDLVAKKEEKCRFWPACKEGTACQYIHPAKTCNTFPNCRFGDKCVYIHPNCKFDASCTKLNCPFQHTVSRGLGLVNPVIKPKIANPKTMIKCRYYPKCVDMNCPFMHPKQICRYGKSCQTPSCLFVHPDVTTGSLLKWKAPKPADKTIAATAVPTASSKITPTAAV